MIRLQQKISILRISLAISVIIAAIKFLTYYLTHSNAVLTDALESIINIVAGIFALYSVILAAKPRDLDHPYGHGKVEFLSAGFEGALISIAGALMIGKAIYNFIFPQALTQLDIGIYLTLFSGATNYLLGKFLETKGRKLQSLTIEADGKHISADAYSSIGLLAGLLLIYLTGQNWIDNIVTLVLGLMIILTGYKLMRKSVAGVMDETDKKTIEELIEVINSVRKKEWIDIHNLRVIKYGSDLHIDCHVTLPWYHNLQSSHDEIKQVETIISSKKENTVEVFIHPDPCLPSSCSICQIENCEVRQHDFKKKIEWNFDNVVANKKHE